MFELLARLFRVLWRQDLGGTGGSAVILNFASAASQQPTGGEAKPAAAPVAFIRQVGAAASQAGAARPAAARHLCVQLHSVARLNGPTSRARRSPGLAIAHKPKPVVAAAPLKRTPTAKPGAVIGRLAKTGGRGGAAIIDLAEVRADARRAKLIETVDREIVALFN
jgi:hypothetical protein